ncbi:MAG: NFACT RNA binding domain-containing protein [Bacteroidia bacterium]
MQSLHQHKNFIHAVAACLQQTLFGFVLVDAFRKNKSECVLNFADTNGNCLSIRLMVQHNTFFLFFDEFLHARTDGVYPLFKDVLNVTFKIQINANDRLFLLTFTNQFNLVFKLYGPLANILLLNPNNQVISLFKPEIESDNEFEINNEELSDASKNLLQTFMVCGKPQVAIITENKGCEDLLYKGENALQASNFFAKLFLAQTKFISTKLSLIEKYTSLLKKSEAGILSTKIALNNLPTQTTLEQLGHIIMANLHQLQKGTTTAKLFDFYNNCEVEIKLKKDLSPQENASYYYKKAKSISTQIKTLEQKLTQYQQQQVFANEILKQIEKAANLKDLKPLFEKQEKKSENKTEKFKTFTYNGFTIWVGKSAANNDELTLKHAHKNDMWLHAKDVTGSHVVIKQLGNKPFTKEVIAYAASIAAAYSKAKHSSLVPVSYTLKKYVRKPKGSLPGQVLVDKEEVILVEPIK